MKKDHLFRLEQNGRTYWGYLFLFLLYFFSTSTGLAQSFCGTYQAVAPATNNLDSTVLDRFGNRFTWNKLAIPLTAQSSINNTNYFEVTSLGNPPVGVMDVVTEVLDYISATIIQQQGNTDCGVIPIQDVNLQLAWISFSSPDPVLVNALDIDLPLPTDGAGIGTPFYTGPEDNACDELVLERPYMKINGGLPIPNNIFDARILLNSDVNWNLLSSSTNFPGQIDLFSVVLHEMLHALGYASRVGLGEAFSIWDQNLRTTDAYIPGGGGSNIQDLLVTTNGQCDLNCWQINPAIGSVSSLANNSCNDPNPDVVFGDAAIAPIGGNAGSNSNLANQLSHLNSGCNGQSGSAFNYVMQTGIMPNEARRVITDSELQILCGLGYTINGTTSCQGCYVIPHYDQYYDSESPCCYAYRNVCLGETITILNEDLLCNDITNGASDLEVVRIWSSYNSVLILPNSNGTGWDITVSPTYPATALLVFYTVAGCDCKMANHEFQITVENQCMECEFTPDPCDNQICNADFEEFTNQSTVPYTFNWPIMFQGARVPATPDIIVTNTGNHYVHLGNYTFSREAIVLPLQTCVPPDCRMELSMDLSKNHAGLSQIEVWGSNSLPCSVYDSPLIQIGNNCDSPTDCGGGVIYNPHCIATIDAINQQTSNDLPNFGSSGTINWVNNTSEDICYVTFVPNGPPSVYFDNVSVEFYCDPQLSCNVPEEIEVCQGEIATIPFEICASAAGICSGFVGVEFNPVLPPGWTLVGPAPDPVILFPGECVTIELMVQMPPGTDIGTMVNVGLQGLVDGQVAVECFTKVTVIMCTPNQPFTCPCGPGGLNLDATAASPYYDALLGGVRFSDLQAAFQYDQNNDGYLTLSEHQNCIAINGRLIMDQDIQIVACDNIQMQPCSEIVIGTDLEFPDVNFTDNTIYSCDIMWHGITVNPFAALTFERNEIRDAQFAITAIGSSGLGTDPPTKMLAYGNTFTNNHVGVFVPTSPYASLTHIPFSENVFEADYSHPVWPACDADLPNYNPNFIAYAGVVTLGTPLTIGVPASSGIDNEFKYIRNGVIAENANVNVYRSDFFEIRGGINSGPTFASSSGIGVAANGGVLTVDRCNFNTVMTGIYAYNTPRFTATNNTMNPVGFGIEVFGAKSTKISDNSSIGFVFRGIRCRELLPALGLNSHKITNNSNLFNGVFSGLTSNPFPPYPAAIDIDHTLSFDIGKGSISNNVFNGNQLNDGIRINGSGNWNLDGNIINFLNPASPNFSNPGTGIKLTNTHENYLYQNTINDLDLSAPVSTGLSLADGTGNRFCCNITRSNRFGSRFMGACSSTEWRVTTAEDTEFALHCTGGTVISEQTSHGNMFEIGSGTAFHSGNQFQVQQSRFRVLNTVQPNWPEFIDTPNSFIPWFVDDGSSASCTSPCDPPENSNAPPDREFNSADYETVNGSWLAGEYGAALQWEAERRLYERMILYPAMPGATAATGSFFTQAGAGKIGAYQEAEWLSKERMTIPTGTESSLQEAMDSIEYHRMLLEGYLLDLATATTSQDSASLFAQANAEYQILVQLAEVLSGLEAMLPVYRLEKTLDALTLTCPLPTENVLEQNRKTVQLVYLQSIGAGNSHLNTQQLQLIEPIAFQCPLEGGSAVFAARALYRLNSDAEFDDDLLCVQSQERSPEMQVVRQEGVLNLVPNPANDRVRITGLSATPGQQIQVNVYNINGAQFISNELNADDPVLNTSELPAGIYICKLTLADNSVEVLKLVISR